MTIELKKIGTTLISRQMGRESFLALQFLFKNLKNKENIDVNFAGVLTFSPAWADEFLTPLINNYGERLTLKNTRNPSVQATLEILQKINGKEFKISD